MGGPGQNMGMFLGGEDLNGQPPEEKRQSYLDVVRESLEAQNKTSMTYRVVVVGELAKELDRVEYSYPNSAEMQTALPATLMMSNVRILLLSDDVSSRFYPFWASRVIDSKDDASREVDMSLFADNDSLDKLSELKHAFEEITERYRELLPHQNLLCEIAACGGIMSVEEWLEAFEGHMKLTLESELVWPAAKPLAV
eukprot:jgi/Hompol1/5304/HPOL_004314-RA